MTWLALKRIQSIFQLDVPVGLRDLTDAEIKELNALIEPSMKTEELVSKVETPRKHTEFIKGILGLRNVELLNVFLSKTSVDYP
jgi:hypothetical protein